MNIELPKSTLSVKKCMHPPSTKPRFDAKVGDELLISHTSGESFVTIISIHSEHLRVIDYNGREYDVQENQVLALSLG